MQHIGSLLQNSPIIVEVTKKLKQLEEIKTLVSSFLPKELAKNCLVADLRAEILVIVTNSPVWKYQLNFLKMELLAHLRASSSLLAGISSISIVIDYLEENLLPQNNDACLEILGYTNKKPLNKNFIISKSNALLVNEIIEQEIHDQRLKIRLKEFIAKIECRN